MPKRLDYFTAPRRKGLRQGAIFSLGNMHRTLGEGYAAKVMQRLRAWYRKSRQIRDIAMAGIRLAVLLLEGSWRCRAPKEVAGAAIARLGGTGTGKRRKYSLGGWSDHASG